MISLVSSKYRMRFTTVFRRCQLFHISLHQIFTMLPVKGIMFTLQKTSNREIIHPIIKQVFSKNTR